MREIFRQYFTKGFGFGAGFIAVLFTAGLLAVAVSTLTTFTTGTPAKASEVNANFAALKSAIEGIPNWTKSGTTAVYSDGNVTVSGKVSSTNLGIFCSNTSAITNGGSFTSGSTNGNISYGGLSGYRGAKKACETACNNTNAHICSNHETVISYQLGLSIGTGWIASPAVTDFATNAVFDCGGFTTSTGSNGGTIGQASSVSSQMCSGSFAVLCCL
jgi:hypothetical protein